MQVLVQDFNCAFQENILLQVGYVYVFLFLLFQNLNGYFVFTDRRKFRIQKGPQWKNLHETKLTALLMETEKHNQ